MASTKEIRTKISSVQNTQKITNAMEMVATSKMRRVQERMENTRPYSEAILNVITHVAKCSGSSKSHKYIVERSLKKALLIVVSTDRGLCGGLNTQVFKKVLHKINDLNNKGVTVELAVIGNKALSFFKHLGVKIISQKTGLGDHPTLQDLLGFITSVVKKFDDKEVDVVDIFYNNFVNTMTQTVKELRLLPLPSIAEEAFNDSSTWDYVYEPDETSLLDELIIRFVEARFYYSILDNLACEQAARMIAMKAATDNASDMIHNLKLVYNKARQASITNELNEIVAGAAVV